MNIDAVISPELAAESEAGRNTHLLLGLCIASCLAFIGWATVATLDIVSLANGEVIPSSQVKNVQHLEGGIVREISIAEGDHVKQGQQLIVLESMQTGADVGEIQVR
ncbi:MAG: biotin/lipoyl-binding protein, partial [Rhodospirillales bacterium]|nr:biotin/lipoyl-binding protein [Rhodospirillales bacterium]